jgi:carbon-monoxide dehydrogenase small subunit
LGKFPLHLNVNGQDHVIMVNPWERLLDVLRDRLGLKGTKEGCGTGDCGICAVLMNGKLVNSCLVLAVQARNCRIVTIEGIGSPEKLHPVQKAFINLSASQCGYCIPAMILAAKDLLDRNPNPSDTEIRKATSGVLCRCTGYVKIIEAVREAGEEIQARRAAG